MATLMRIGQSTKTIYKKIENTNFISDKSLETIYPLTIIKKRLTKQISPGVIYFNNKIYATSLTKQINISHKYIIGCSILLVLVLSTILWIVIQYYLNPYTILANYEKQVEVQVTQTEALFKNSGLAAQMFKFKIEDWTTIQYPDDTMLITIPAQGKFEELVEAVAKSKGILSIQYSNDTFYVILVKGAL